MRNTEFVDDEYYHLVNRGIDKKKIFNQSADYARFLSLILHCQSPITINNLGYISRDFNQIGRFRVSKEKTNKIINNRYVELTAFCLMPNHFHLLVKQVTENGVSKYMQRIQNAYAKFFNTKLQINGHLFQGPFRAKMIEDNDQLLYLSAYIHKNPTELKGWQKQEAEYPWSSLADYLNHNRWPNLLETKIILEQFDDQKEYRDWVENSPAKDQSNY